MKKLYIIAIVLSIFASMSYIFFDTFYRMQELASDLTEKRENQEYDKAAMSLKNYMDITYSAVDSLYTRSSDIEYIEKRFGDNLKHAINIAEIIIEQRLELVKKRKLSIKKAQKQAIEKIEAIRYNNDKSYIWIAENKKPFPKVIMHPLIPALNDKFIDDSFYNNPNTNKSLFDNLLEKLNKNLEEFFIYHSWYSEIDKKDISYIFYVKLVPKWDWMLITEVNIEDIIKDGLANIKETIRAMRYNNGIGYFWIIDVSNKKTPKYIMHPFDPDRENKFLEGNLKKYKSRVNTFIQVAEKNNGKGFVEYKGEKPTSQGIISGVSKLSYIKIHTGSNWLIGTGAYLDGIEIEVKKTKKYFTQKIEQILFRLGILNIVVFLVGILASLIIFIKKSAKISSTTS